MSDSERLVGGLRLPVELVVAIKAGAWHPPTNPQLYVDLFSDSPEQPEFYDLDGIDRQNRSWQAMSIEDAFGEEIEGKSLGVDPGRSVVIGDLGPDMPIVLDFRDSIENPSVLYLDFDDGPRWVKVAVNFRSFLECLQRSP